MIRLLVPVLLSVLFVLLVVMARSLLGPVLDKPTEVISRATGLDYYDVATSLIFLTGALVGAFLPSVYRRVSGPALRALSFCLVGKREPGCMS
jgi:hypothetical protein